MGFSMPYCADFSYEFGLSAIIAGPWKGWEEVIEPDRREYWFAGECRLFVSDEIDYCPIRREQK